MQAKVDAKSKRDQIEALKKKCKAKSTMFDQVRFALSGIALVEKQIY